MDWEGWLAVLLPRPAPVFAGKPLYTASLLGDLKALYDADYLRAAQPAYPWSSDGHEA